MAADNPQRPPWRQLFSAVNAAGRALRRLGAWPEGLDAARLKGAAAADTGLTDFGGDEFDEDDFNEGLERLLRSYREEAALSPLGAIAARVDTLRLLENRLRVVADARRHPEIGEQQVRAPIFILGLPRTGSTLLHGLLAQDPASRAPRSWEVMYPSPPPDPASLARDPRPARVRRQFRWFDRMAPDYKVAHPIGAGLPQECMAIEEHAFMSQRFHRTHRLPSYAEWLYDQDHAPAYRLHRHLLGHLQWRWPGERWVLKSPPHTFWVETLAQVYPDARFVQTHRDPLTVMASFASHTTRLRRPFTERPASFDAQRAARRWAAGLERLTAFRDRPELAGRFVDVHYADLRRDPVGEAERIYRHFSLPWSDGLGERMRRFVAANPKDRHGVHRYTLAEWGLDPERDAAPFGGYVARFGVEPLAEDITKAWPAGGGPAGAGRPA